MRKLFTLILTAMTAVVCSASIKPVVSTTLVDYEGVESLHGVTFTIVNKAEGKALYGSNNQNLAYGDYAAAFKSGNSGYVWKLVSLANDADEAVHGYYRLQLVRPTGADYNCWGMGGVLNSQPTSGNCCFILGLNNQNGQDIKNGAVWDIEYVEGQGYALKNIGTGHYKAANTDAAKSESPVYFSFCKLEESYDYVPALKNLLAEGETLKATVTNAEVVATYEAAVADINPETTQDALADAKVVDAAIVALVKGQNVAGADYTRAIINPSFETNDLEGWISQDCGATATNRNFGKLTGDIFVEKWTPSANKLSNGTLSQQLTALPNGTYQLTAEMQNLEQGNGNADGKGFFLFANEDETEVATAGETVVVNTVVTDGTLNIGVVLRDCTGNWMCVDNFRLTLVEPANPDVPTAINTVAKAAKVEGKFVENGKIVIVRGDKKFNVAGVELK